MRYRTIPMPLAFNSRSHGVVPFGFFNVASDLLILRDHFAFASDVCGWFGEWAESRQAGATYKVPMWVIADPAAIGDLGGAMQGVDHGGLIGRSYRLFPFPVRREDFRQDPDGHVTRSAMEPLLTEFAGEARPIAVHVADDVVIGPYVFAAADFRELVLYLWRGGMPRWRDEIRPAYVTRMMGSVRASTQPVFAEGTWPAP